MNKHVNISQPKIVNGINVEDLVALVDSIRQDPAKARTDWHVTTNWRGQAMSRTEVEGFGMGGDHVPRRFSIDIDEPCELGGTNRHANPQEHLLAALGACMMVGFVAQCAMRGIALEDLSIETDGTIDLRPFLGIDPGMAAGYENLKCKVRVRGSGTKEQFAEVLAAVMATSPNFYNLTRPVAVEPALIVA
jgi:uncharacterized OsmC-like protein